MPLTEAELEPLLRLSLVQGIGPQRMALLIDRLGSPVAVLRARERELLAVPGVGRELASRIRASGGRAALAETRRALRTLGRLGVVALTQESPGYPASFLDLPDRPYLLFAAGDLGLVQRPAVAVVGTRSPTHYGRSAAKSLSCELAAAGFVIVSGMARGVDATAHQGALDAGGGTVGVLGHGIEQIYPPEGRKLFERVRQHGLLLTEYPPGETPRAGNFPRHNRLIAALSRAVLVVEMALRSGAQHTVSYALEQGKEVMAVPGPISSPASAGTNQLIKDGARMVTSAADVIEELFGVGYVATAGTPNGPRAGASGPPALELLDRAEELVLASVEHSACHIDQIAREARLPTAETLAVLLELELRGLVISLPGMRYCRG